MPLFSSKFTFKKSNKRSSRRTLTTANDLPHLEESDDSDSSDDDHDEMVDKNRAKHRSVNGHNHQNNSSLQILKSKRKKDDSTIRKEAPLLQRQSSTTKIRSKRNGPLETKSNGFDNLILYMDQRIEKYKFDFKHGVWEQLIKKPVQQTSDSDHLTIGDDSSPNPTIIDSNEQVAELIDTISKLKEENRLLKLKIEILIEMVTETTAELNLKEGGSNKDSKL